MKCSKCNTEINANVKTCPQCGENLAVNDPSEINSAHQVKKKPMPGWFKLLIGLTFLALVAVSGGILFTESLVDVVDKQLESLRKGDTEKAYQAYSSQEFKARTSLDEFKEFIATHSIFRTNHSALFPKRSIVDHITILRGKLMASEHVEVPIEYRLIKEDGKWKILSLRLLRNQSQNMPEKRKIIQVTRSLLQNILEDNIEPAYVEYASSDFKANTSLEDFKNLINRYPLFLQDYHMSFYNPIIQDHTGSLATTLRSKDKIAYLKSYYVYDPQEEAWKISGLRILSPEN